MSKRRSSTRIIKSQPPAALKTDEAAYENIYQLAQLLATRSHATYIINIGTDNIDLLVTLSSLFKIIVIDSPINILKVKHFLPSARFIQCNLGDFCPRISSVLLKSAVVISTYGRGTNAPFKNYFQIIKYLSDNALYVLTAYLDQKRTKDTTPERNEAGFQITKSKLIAQFRKHRIDHYLLGHTQYKQGLNDKPVLLAITGKFVYPKKITKSKLKVLAILTVFNEEDILAQTIEHLLHEGLHVHLIDNWSTDSSLKIIKNYKSKYPQRISYEQFPVKPSPYFELLKITEYVDKIASKCDADWIMHYDADELRVSPWKNISLLDAIKAIDYWGFNAIDFTILNFVPTKDGFSKDRNPHHFFQYASFGDKTGHFHQVKAWKNQRRRVKLKNMAGHSVNFPNMKIFPIKFLTKHYPLRSQTQAARKIFKERKPRFSPIETKYGMHTHYNHHDKNQSFIEKKTDHIYFHTPNFDDEYLVERISGIGITVSD